MRRAGHQDMKCVQARRRCCYQAAAFSCLNMPHPRPVPCECVRSSPTHHHTLCLGVFKPGGLSALGKHKHARPPATLLVCWVPPCLPPCCPLADPLCCVWPGALCALLVPSTEWTGKVCEDSLLGKQGYQTNTDGSARSPGRHQQDAFSLLKMSAVRTAIRQRPSLNVVNWLPSICGAMLVAR